MPEDKKQIPQRLRAAQFVPNTFNADDNSIDVVAATDTPVLQVGWDGLFTETLLMQPENVRLDRFNNGANVLDNHNRYGSVQTTVLGVITKAWLEDGKLRATIRLSKRPELASFVQDVKDGIQRNLSIGYNVYTYVIEESAGQMDNYSASDWEPCELSFTQVPADYLSTVRSQNENVKTNEVTIIKNSKTRNMPETQEGATPTVTTPGAPASTGSAESNTPSTVNVENERSAATQAERTRSSQIIAACRAAGFDIEYAQTLIDDPKMDINKARAAIIEKMATGQAPASRSASTVIVTEDEQVKERNAIEYALLHRTESEKYPLNKKDDVTSTLANNFRGISVLDAAKVLLNQRGMKVTGFNKQELFERSMSTADFPNVLANIANKFLRSDYTATPQTFKQLASKQNLPDFKSSNGVNFGGDINFEEVKEGAEFKYGSLTETADNWKLSTYGKILRFTRQMFINDDLGAFNRIAKIIARGAANNESNVFWSLITGNVKMYDGTVLFHASHGNLAGSGAAISTTTMDAARTAMQRQKGLKNDYIQVTPKYLVVAPEQQMAAQQLLTNIIPNQLGEVNVFVNSGLVPIVEVRLASGGWYVFADPNSLEGFTYGYLEGNEGLYTETRFGFNVDGVEMKCRQDFGVHAWDWRGAYKNPGA